jgi:large subunit ribosomal protein L15
MKLHDLRPAMGAHHPRKRVGRGIAAGGGKTAGRGTKGQKARAGAAIPAWFEGGQTPLQMRIPKLHGFKNRFRVEYEVVNLGRIAALVDAGIFEPGELPGGKKGTTPPAKAAPITINQEILRASGLVSTLKKPLKVLGNGDLTVALFVVADAFSRSAISKIEAAGGTVQVLEVPREPLAALGLDAPAGEDHPVEADHGGHDHTAAEAAPSMAEAAAPAEPVVDDQAAVEEAETPASAAPKGSAAKAPAKAAAKAPAAKFAADKAPAAKVAADKAPAAKAAPAKATGKTTGKASSTKTTAKAGAKTTAKASPAARKSPAKSSDAPTGDA